jgi:hypothetical protein
MTHLGAGAWGRERAALGLRARSVARIIAELARADPLTSLGVVALLAAAAWYAAGMARRPDGARAVAAAASALPWLVHGSRRDARWLRTAGVRTRAVFAAEYALLTAPLAGLLAVNAASVLLAAAPLLSAGACALAPAGGLLAWAARRELRTPARLPVPADAFEWLAGLRRRWPGVLLVYAAALYLSRIESVPPLAVMALAWVAAECYADGDEGWPLVVAFRRGPAAFLRRKLTRALAPFAVLAAPLVALGIVRHPAFWPLTAFGLAGAMAVLAGAALVKYSRYEPGTRASVAIAIGTLVLTASLVVPPVTVLLLVRLWRQALRTVGHYLAEPLRTPAAA